MVSRNVRTDNSNAHAGDKLQRKRKLKAGQRIYDKIPLAIDCVMHAIGYYDQGSNKGNNSNVYLADLILFTVVDGSPLGRLDLFVLEPFDAGSGSHAVRNDDVVDIVRRPSAHHIVEDGTTMAGPVVAPRRRRDAIAVARVRRGREGAAVLVQRVSRQGSALPSLQQCPSPLRLEIVVSTTSASANTSTAIRLLPLSVAAVVGGSTLGGAARFFVAGFGAGSTQRFGWSGRR